MPARVQRRDALILKNELKLNLVRTSHYPQAPSFLDCCDEIGLLVLEEIPGWQHIGDKAWQDIAVRNVGEMIRRDWNHPSDHSVGRAHQRVAGQSRLLYAHERSGALAGRRAADRRHSLSVRFRTAGRRVHHERFRFPVEEAESSAVSEYRVQRPHVLHQALRQRGACCRACPAARARAQSTGVRRPLCGRHRLVRLRLQHARQFRLGRSHLLSRRQRHLPHSEACRGRVQIAMRSERGSSDRAGLLLVIGR